jgi:hypothetical protein
LYNAAQPVKRKEQHVKTFVIAALFAVAVSAVQAQNTYTVNPTDCLAGPIQCVVIPQQDYFQASGEYAITFAAGAQPSSFPSTFSVQELSGPNDIVVTNYTPAVAWGYNGNYTWTASFKSPLGRQVSLDFIYVTGAHYGTGWAIKGGLVVGPSILLH